MEDKTEVPEQANEEIKRQATRRARERARVARWDLNVAVFLFAVLIIVIILLFQGIGTEVVAPVAVFGLAMVWFVGWRRGRQLYESFYDEEVARLEHDFGKKRKPPAQRVGRRVKETIEETIEEKVQKALRERWRGDSQ